MNHILLKKIKLYKIFFTFGIIVCLQSNHWFLFRVGFILVWCGFHVGIWQIRADGLTKMSTEIEPHITKKYEIKKRLGKGVSIWLFRFYLFNNTCFTVNFKMYLGTYVSRFLMCRYLIHGSQYFCFVHVIITFHYKGLESDRTLEEKNPNY